MNSPIKSPYPFFHLNPQHKNHAEAIIKSAVASIKKNTVLCTAVFFAVLTSFIVPPDSKYVGYVDVKTIVCLFSTLAVVGALKNISFFTILARRIVSLTGNLRMAVLALIYITFLGSMLIANDMALLTFLPLGYYVLSSTNSEKYMAFTFIMQNIAANLGGMLTPFGNPQNLYLYSKFNIPTNEFMAIMASPFILSTLLITVICLIVVPKNPISCAEDSNTKLPIARTVIYLILFACAIIIVFRIIPYILGLILITAALFVMDRKALKKVDYPLLFTFIAFFVFAGNMSRIPVVSNVFSFLLEKNTLIFSSLSCQVISNVPSAILLSQFTENWQQLLVGVNIGGAGTLIASLASLITFSQFTKRYPDKTKSYIILFSILNFAFLIILALFESVIFSL